jgi:hypothetical protein
MVFLRLIAAMVLAYCTIVTANPASDAWFTKEINELMEAKEQMDELINDGEPRTEEYEGEEIETPWVEEELENDAFTEATDFNELVSSMAKPQVCVEKKKEKECDRKLLIRITETVKEFCAKVGKLVIEIEGSLEGSATGDGSRENPGDSCKSIKNAYPSFESRTYWLRGINGPVEVHCDMGSNVCGGQSGGWMRIADVDMTQSEDCPSPLDKIVVGGKALCGTINKNPGCFSSTYFVTHGIQYTRICGRIRGYQEGSTDAFGTPIVAKNGKRGVSIHHAYVDGISLTHGYTREHIWTFASALNDLSEGFTFAQCPCVRPFDKNARQPQVPDFVKKNLFCDTANQNPGKERIPKGDIVFMRNPLWDGKGCSPQNGCCNQAGLPWFSRSFESPTCDDVEMRVCNDEGTKNENVLIDQIELYVQ